MEAGQSRTRVRWAPGKLHKELQATQSRPGVVNGHKWGRSKHEAVRRRLPATDTISNVWLVTWVQMCALLDNNLRGWCVD